MVTLEKLHTTILDFGQEYEIISEICKNVCREPDLVDDLIQEVSIIWLQQPEDKKPGIRSYFKFWISRVVTNQYHSKTSPFWTKYRKGFFVEYTDAYDPEDVQYPDEPEWDVQKAINDLFPADKVLIEMFYFKNLTITQIAKKRGIDRSWVSLQLKRIRGLLKLDHELFGMSTTQIRSRATDELINYVGKSRLSTEEGTRILLYYRKLTGSNNNNMLLKENIKGALKFLIHDLKL